MTTKREIREYAQRTREELRRVEKALRDNRLEDAEIAATDAAGCAGEIENLVQAYADEHGPNYRSSGD